MTHSIVRRLGAALILSVLPLAANSCVGATDEADTDPSRSARDALYIKTKALWSVQQIPVCWAHPNAFPQEEAWVRAAIETTWDLHSPIDFVGWGPCSGGNEIEIHVSDEQPYAKGHALTLNFTFVDWEPKCQMTRQRCIQQIAIHEFGHALGFAHEQNRPDTPEFCKDQSQGSKGDWLVGEWDYNSVMNYCNPRPTTLSATDIVGLHHAYKHPALFLTGRFDGDSRADVLCHDPNPESGSSPGSNAVALSTGSGFTAGGVWLSGWCSHARATFGTGDFDGDGLTDIWCHDPIEQGSPGNTSIALSNGGSFTAAGVWSSNWCSHPGAMFGTGDFNGDGRTDLWCHDPIVKGSPGNTWVALSNGVDRFTDGGIWLSGWCNHYGARFGVGDFDGDGNDDLYCHDYQSGDLWVARSDGFSRFDSGLPVVTEFCMAMGAKMGIGDFNADGAADFYCHDGVSIESSGATHVLLANGAGSFKKPSVWHSGWCRSGGDWMGIGDFNGDGRTDLWCHDPPAAGRSLTRVALTNPRGTGFASVTIWPPRGWCSHEGATMGVADFDGNGSSDLWCHDPIDGLSAGNTWIARSNGFNAFDVGGGAPWLTGWCNHFQ